MTDSDFPAWRVENAARRFAYFENGVILYRLTVYMVAVAQLVRASGCGPEGRRFNSGQSPQFLTLLAEHVQQGGFVFLWTGVDNKADRR